MFTPVEPLAVKTTYTITISEIAKDLGGFNLETKFSWSFTTSSENKTSDINETDPSEIKEPKEKKEENDLTIIFAIIAISVLPVILLIIIFLLIRKRKPVSVSAPAPSTAIQRDGFTQTEENDLRQLRPEAA